MPRTAMKQNGSPPLPSSSAVPLSSASTLAPIRSTESTTRHERGSYLKKRHIDDITYRQGCPTDKHSDATVRDEDPISEMSSYASRDGCELASCTSSPAPPNKDNRDSPLYVIQKKGVDRQSSRVAKVSQAYSFEDYWSIFDSVVDGCRCISIAGACTAVPSTSFGDEEDTAGAAGKSSYNSSSAYPHPTSRSPSSTGSNYYDINDSTKPSPTSSAVNIGPDTFHASNNSILEASSVRKGRQVGSNSRLAILRDLERELSDDEDFRPAHRTSACFVLHEKDKVNDIFR